MASIQVTRRHCLKMMCGILFITSSHMVHHGQTDLLSGYVEMKFKIPESSRTDMELSAAAAVTFTRCLTHRLLKQSAARETDGQFGMNTPRGRQSLMRVKPTEATMLLRWTRTRYAIKMQMLPLLLRRGCVSVARMLLHYAWAPDNGVHVAHFPLTTREGEREAALATPYISP